MYFVDKPKFPFRSLLVRVRAGCIVQIYILYNMYKSVYYVWLKICLSRIHISSHHHQGLIIQHSRSTTIIIDPHTYYLAGLFFPNTCTEISIKTPTSSWPLERYVRIVFDLTSIKLSWPPHSLLTQVSCICIYVCGQVEWRTVQRGWMARGLLLYCVIAAQTVCGG